MTTMYALMEFSSTFDTIKWLNASAIAPDRIVSILIQQQPIPIVSVIYLRER